MSEHCDLYECCHDKINCITSQSIDIILCFCLNLPAAAEINY